MKKRGSGSCLPGLSRYWKHHVMGWVDTGQALGVWHGRHLPRHLPPHPCSLCGFLPPAGVMAASDPCKSRPTCVRMDAELWPWALHLPWHTHTWGTETRSTWGHLEARPDSQAGSSELLGQRIWLRTHNTWAWNHSNFQWFCGCVCFFGGGHAMWLVGS